MINGLGVVAFCLVHIAQLQGRSGPKIQTLRLTERNGAFIMHDGRIRTILALKSTPPTIMKFGFIVERGKKGFLIRFQSRGCFL